MFKKIVVGIALIGLVAGGIHFFWPSKISPSADYNSATKGFVKEGEVAFMDSAGNPLVRIDVEIASRPEERNQGLMYRDFMPARFGMLFIFEQSAPRSFWMRNTVIPLDLIFVDDNNRIVSIQTDTKPYSDDPIPSNGPARYVIEVNSGFCQKNNIKVGGWAKF